MLAVDAVKPTELPRSADGKMAKIIYAFDVDGTLVKNGQAERQHGKVNDGYVPRVDWINTLMLLSTAKNVRIVVWSGGGKQYAEMLGKRLGLDKYVWRYDSKLNHAEYKAKCDHLIAIDDIHANALGDINLIVGQDRE